MDADRPGFSVVLPTDCRATELGPSVFARGFGRRASSRVGGLRTLTSDLPQARELYIRQCLRAKPFY